MIPDCFVYSANAQANQNIRVMREFAAEQGIKYFQDVGTPQYKGICHIGLAEGGILVLMKCCPAPIRTP
ncbi:hypothetical protein [Erwinia aphidicola]|uniref:hypothetical protein n=1 Tax=Erwinia aphidicola TaxID=68334 RepID=UPI0030CC6AA8